MVEVGLLDTDGDKQSLGARCELLELIEKARGLPDRVRHDVTAERREDGKTEGRKELSS
jgi:hypothetical protein